MDTSIELDTNQNNDPNIPIQLKNAAARVGKDEYTVRELIGWFGHLRRGVNVNDRIDQALAAQNLETQPDFRSVYIDATVRLVPREQVVRSAMLDDPTDRVSRFRTANTELVSVRAEESLEVAVTKMLLHNFSQLPVLAGPRSIKGVISWKSIGTRLTQGNEADTVKDFMDTTVAVIKLSDSILHAVERIVNNDFVLVQDQKGEFTGIVTTADLSELFRDLATPFLLLGEIENHLRGLLDGRFKPSELAAARPKGSSPQSNVRLSDLTFGDYYQLIGKKNYWPRLGLHLDRNDFIEELDAIREIRNAVMHFDPDRLDEISMDRLSRFAELLRRLREVRPSTSST